MDNLECIYVWGIENFIFDDEVRCLNEIVMNGVLIKFVVVFNLNGIMLYKNLCMF